MADPFPPQVAYVNDAMQMNRTVNSYNGFIFPAAAGMKLQVEPVYESSGRLPKYHKHTITIEFIVTSRFAPQLDLGAASPVDINMETLKRLLSVPGRILILSRRGLGATTKDTASETFEVNSNNDLAFGPKPMLLLWESVGASQAIRVQWSVEFCVPLCCYMDSTGDTICDNPSDLSHSLYILNLIDFSYSMSFGVDDEGFLTRSIIGSAEVPGHFFQDVALMPGADPDHSTPNESLMLDLNFLQTRIQSIFARIPRFQRDWQWDTSRDGVRVDFRITDREIHSDNPYIEGIIKCDMDHSIESSLPFYKWNCSLSGSFTIGQGYSRDQGWTAFLIVLQSRLQRLQLIIDNSLLKEFNNSGNVDLNKLPAAPTYIPNRIQMRESIYSRKASFTFGYTVFCSLNKIMSASGLFQTTPGDWTTWTATLPSSLVTGRGSRDMASGGVSNIVTICTGPTPPSNNSTIAGIQEGFTLDKLFNTQCPPADKSWLDYKLWFRDHSEGTVTEHQKTYAVPESQYKDTGGSNLRTVDSYINPVADRDYQVVGVDPSIQNIFQAMSCYSHVLVMKGYAIRACYRIPLPSIERYGNADKLFVISCETEERLMSSVGPVNIYGRWWKITYAMPKGYGGSAPQINLDTNGVPQTYLEGQ